MSEKSTETSETIFEAIASAVGDVKKIGKVDYNKFDNYDFASIDKFLELVNPICAAHGLFPSITQDSVEFYENTNAKGGKSTWARFYYKIAMHHKSGGTFGPIASMVSVPMNGAQASGSAQSYAIKQFFRGIFMIPTGDKDDADLAPTEQHHTVKDEPQFNAGAARDRIKAKIEKAATLDDLVEVWKSEAETIAEVKAASAPMFAELNAAKDARKAALTPKDADLGGDEIPDFDGEKK